MLGSSTDSSYSSDDVARRGLRGDKLKNYNKDKALEYILTALADRQTLVRWYYGGEAARGIVRNDYWQHLTACYDVQQCHDPRANESDPSPFAVGQNNAYTRIYTYCQSVLSMRKSK